MVKRIIGFGVLLLGLIVVGLQIDKYYQRNYKPQTGFARVTETPKREPTKDKYGKVQSGLYSYNYHFEWILTDGTHRKMSYELSNENPRPLVKGRYVTAKLSQKRIVEGPKNIDQARIPAAILRALKK